MNSDLQQRRQRSGRWRLEQYLSACGAIVWLIAMTFLYSRVWVPQLPAWKNGEWQKDNSPLHAILAWTADGLMLGSTVLFLIASYFGWKHQRRNRREVSGLCVQCGYDLRASIERCPECGSEMKNAVRRLGVLTDRLTSQEQDGG